MFILTKLLNESLILGIFILDREEKNVFVFFLTDSEKPKMLSPFSTLERSKILGHDHKTIKLLVANSQLGHRIEKKRCKLTAKDLRRIKREATRKSLSSSAVIFQNCNLPGVPRGTRFSVLRDMAKVRRAETRPPLNKTS